MSEVGVATTPDANSAYWNAGKLEFVNQKTGLSFSYAPRLGKPVGDMSLIYLAGFFNIEANPTFGRDLLFFDLGSTQLTYGNGNELVEFGPRDIVIEGTFSGKLTMNLGLGISSRFINSNLSGFISSVGGSKGRPGIGVRADVGLYYQKEILTGSNEGSFSWGMNISNNNPKITYNGAEDLHYIPTNFRLGAVCPVDLNQVNTFMFALDVNKLLVPTPPVYAADEDGTLGTDTDGNLIIQAGEGPNRSLSSAMFGSFTDTLGWVFGRASRADDFS